MVNTENGFSQGTLKSETMVGTPQNQVCQMCFGEVRAESKVKSHKPERGKVFSTYTIRMSSTSRRVTIERYDHVKSPSISMVHIHYNNTVVSFGVRKFENQGTAFCLENT